jgi:hypothetical protein
MIAKVTALCLSVSVSLSFSLSLSPSPFLSFSLSAFFRPSTRIPDGLVSRKRLVNGVPTSLADLGYTDAGLDDNWQACGAYGPNQYTFHSDAGVPQVNTTVFPSLKAMTDYGHSLGLTVGWYGNNCICQDHCTSPACYQGDVNAMIEYGFDSIKLDGCGKELDLGLYASLFNATGKAILIENCHWGLTLPNATWCPWNTYRTSFDIRAAYGNVVLNLMSTVPLAKQGLSHPGCWAYPDMLEVGCQHGPGGAGDPGLTFVESRSHFGAWCIVSSPLVLSHDTNNDTISDAVWPIIANTEAIAVNQAWAGESGTLFLSSPSLASSSALDSAAAIDVASTADLWQQWSKMIDATTHATAVLVMNHAATTLSAVDVTFATVPSLAHLPIGTAFTVRDLWAHADLGTFAGGAISIKALASHDSAFLLVTPVPAVDA